ncbi:hypothetical protein F6455_02590 [Proteobacteria bacterium 005FR1]|nr:hypothetical protein [Proteobacteria bacterium 005FR1]
MKRIVGAFLIIVTCSWLPAIAQQVSKEQIRGLDEQVQDIKKDVLDISTELNLLEEKLLYPSNTQVAFFISLVAAKNLELDSVEVEIDGKPVAHHIYSYKELEALRQGGLQRIYTGNARTGEHALNVGFKGKTGAGSAFTEVASYTFSKGVGPEIVEIKLVESAIGSRSVDFVDQ